MRQQRGAGRRRGRASTPTRIVGDDRVPRRRVEPSASTYSRAHDAARRRRGARPSAPRVSGVSGSGSGQPRARRGRRPAPTLRLKNSFSQIAYSSVVAAVPEYGDRRRRGRRRGRSSRGAALRIPAQQRADARRWWMPWRPFSTTNAVSDEVGGDERRQHERVAGAAGTRKSAAAASATTSAAQRTCPSVDPVILHPPPGQQREACPRPRSS